MSNLLRALPDPAFTDPSQAVADRSASQPSATGWRSVLLVVAAIALAPAVLAGAVLWPLFAREAAA